MKRDCYQLLNDWYSISDNLLEKFLLIISATLDRNIEYCKGRARQSVRDGNNSVAELYTRHWLERCRLRKAAIQQLRNLI
ncbi:unnamed protein product [Adineta steineri]|uniref:Uncharacterized protein n=1 Tax=Adineta steineri TaxID=433720 RepID=A0A815HSM5_9BILA|nr:unnamed protein product [Adineta steineri]CAF4131261.1 unnamed protein product [Adineta steineri]